MRPAQNRAVTRLYEYDAVQAVMPMGSGKTCAAMTAIAELKADKHIRAALVMAPKRVCNLVWRKEHLQWEHLAHLKVQMVTGGPAERIKNLTTPGFDIYVVGIDNAQWLFAFLAKLPNDHWLFDVLCIDESSRLRNPRGKRGKAIQKQAKRFRTIWELTGTPRPRGYEDQFRPIQILSREKLWHRSFDIWRNERFINMALHDNAGDDWHIRVEHEKKTVEEIGRFSFTLDDKDLPHLEPIIPVFHWVDLPPKVRAQYKEMERKLLFDDDGKVILAASAGVASGKLAQMANGFIYDEQKQPVDLHTEKADMLVDLVEGAAGDNIVLCYGFQHDLTIIRSLYGDLPYFGAGVSDKKSELYEEAWNEGIIPLLGLHPASGGHGLNLQFGGSMFVWYDMPWNAELYDQTLKRLQRPGQTKRVYAHHILARDTVDEVKYNRVIMRMSEQEAFRQYLEKI